MLYIINNNFSYENEICGIGISGRKIFFRISLWVKTEEIEIVETIRRELKEFLNLPIDIKLMFKPNKNNNFEIKKIKKDQNLNINNNNDFLCLKENNIDEINIKNKDDIDVYNNFNTETDENGNKIMLSLELVPKKIQARNYKPYMPIELWNKFFEERKQLSNNKCEICNNTYNLICHQKWNKDKDNKILKFETFVILCWKCHDVIHFGWSSIEGREKNAIKHLSKVNNWNIKQVNEHISNSFEEWENESDIKWQVNIDVLINSYIYCEWVNKNGDDDIKFGPLCLKRCPSYNNNPKQRFKRS